MPVPGLPAASRGKGKGPGTPAPRGGSRPGAGRDRPPGRARSGRGRGRPAAGPGSGAATRGGGHGRPAGGGVTGCRGGAAGGSAAWDFVGGCPGGRGRGGAGDAARPSVGGEPAVLHACPGRARGPWVRGARRGGRAGSRAPVRPPSADTAGGGGGDPRAGPAGLWGPLPSGLAGVAWRGRRAPGPARGWSSAAPCASAARPAPDALLRPGSEESRWLSSFLGFQEHLGKPGSWEGGVLACRPEAPAEGVRFVSGRWRDRRSPWACLIKGGRLRRGPRARSRVGLRRHALRCGMTAAALPVACTGVRAR